jgi:hypothetical protein
MMIVVKRAAEPIAAPCRSVRNGCGKCGRAALLRAPAWLAAVVAGDILGERPVLANWYIIAYIVVVVRDGFAAVYFHPCYCYADIGQPTIYLQGTIARTLNEGYMLVNSTAVAP